MDIQTLRTFLFVPADRPDRIDKALDSGADAVIVDLEDAVAPDGKEAARQMLAGWLATSERAVFLRINGPGTAWHAADLQLARSALVCGVFLPKAEHPKTVESVHVVTAKPVLPIIESAAGLQHVQRIAEAEGCARLAFGKLDLAIDLGLEPDEGDKNETVFLHYRAQLVVASRVAGLAPPIEGVYTDIHDVEGLAFYCRRARREGFNAVLLIHPKQVATVTAAFAPSAAETAWARRILAAAEQSCGAATVVDGRMVDAPVIARARRLLGDAAPQMP